MVRLDRRAIPADRQECRAFTVVRNEALRLPAWLEHHRALGVDRFFVIDNASSDATPDIVLDQPDCHLFSCTGSYGAASLGLDWINQAIERYGQGYWCLRVDADECLVYPDHERVRLPGLCRYLDQVGALGLYTFMLDMYSRQPIAQADYHAGTPFLDACPYFDKDYTFHRRLGTFPPVEPVGGPRLRRFYPQFSDAGLLRWMAPKLLRRVRQLVGLSGPTTPPMLIKIPLIKGGAASWVNTHWTAPIKLADVTGVLLHFKYFSDFHHRVIAGQQSGQRFDGSAEYAVYAQALRSEPALSFFYPGSRRYVGPQQLVDLGLMQTSAAYRSFGRTLAVARETTAVADAELASETGS